MAQIITKVPKEALGEGKDMERQRCRTIPYRPICPDIPQCVRKWVTDPFANSTNHPSSRNGESLHLRISNGQAQVPVTKLRSLGKHGGSLLLQKE